MVYCEGKNEDGTCEMHHLARSQNCRIWNGRSCQELTSASYGEHRLWTVLLKMNRMYPRNEALVIHIAKPCPYFGFGAKKFLVMYPCENCCQLNFNSSHWWPHFLSQFSITFSPKQVLVIFSHKWLIGLGDQ